jgi:hypothetical protein
MLAKEIHRSQSKMAKILELKTKNGSFVMANIAGTLSIAKQHPLLQ